MTTLTPENYYGSEASKAFMSNSQFNSFMSCQAKALAEINGTWTAPDKDALLVGQYTHVNVLTPERLDAWMDVHGDSVVSAKTKKRYAAFDVAQRMIDRVKSEPDAMALLDGEHERIITFTIGGYPWKAQLDVADFSTDTPSVCDLKTAKDFEPYWDDKAKTKVGWYERYWRQMAVYRVAFKSVISDDALYSGVEPAMYIVGVSKQEPSDVCLLSFDNIARLDAEIDYIAVHLPDIIAVKTGKVAPTHCGKCEYCREHAPKKLQVAESLTWPSLAE